MSREKMINFTGDMVRAILDGSKTQTRRPLRTQPKHIDCLPPDAVPGDVALYLDALWKCSRFSAAIPDAIKWRPMKPSTKTCDTMLVRERARCTALDCVGHGKFRYEADSTETGWVVIPKRLKPLRWGHCVPNGCFKELVRIKRKVVRVWYEQIKSISDKDILAEGVSYIIKPGEAGTLEGQFFRLWSDHYPGSWDRNDWVECTEFEGAARELRTW